jgi:hypothetical protein
MLALISTQACDSCALLHSRHCHCHCFCSQSSGVLTVGCTGAVQVGRRVTTCTVLSGSVVRVWGVLESVLDRHQASLSRSDRIMRVVRVPLPGERSLVGVRYPPHLLQEVVVTLASLATADPHAIAASLAAAAGRQRGAVVEPPTPVHKASLAKAFRAPKTVLDFFKPKAVPGAAAGALPAAAAPAAAAPAAAAAGGQVQAAGAAAVEASAQQEQQQQQQQEEQQQQEQEQQQQQQQQQQASEPEVLELESESQGCDPCEEEEQQQQQPCIQQPSPAPAPSAALQECQQANIMAGTAAQGGQAGAAGEPAAKRQKLQAAAQEVAAASKPAAAQATSTAAGAAATAAEAGATAAGAVACTGPVGDGVGPGSATETCGLPPSSSNRHIQTTAAAAGTGTGTGVDSSIGRQGSIQQGTAAQAKQSIPSRQVFPGLAAGLGAAQRSVPPAGPAGGSIYKASKPSGKATAAARAAAAASSVKQAAIRQLQGMGFSEQQAERALWATSGNVERAVEWILSGM